MHEFAFCQGIITALESEWKLHNISGARLVETRVVIGRMHQVIEENLQMAYAVLTKGTIAEGSKLIITFLDIRYLCNQCGQTGVITPPLFICSHCRSGAIELTTGRELYLEKLELEQDRDPDGDYPDAPG